MLKVISILIALNYVLLILIFKNQKQMATKLEELQQVVTDLQTSVDEKQAAIAAAIQALKDQIAAGAGAATEADLQAIIDSLQATDADIDSTPTD